MYPRTLTLLALIGAGIAIGGCSDLTAVRLLIDGSQAPGVIVAPDDVNRLVVTVSSDGEVVWTRTFPLSGGSRPLAESVRLRPGRAADGSILVDVSGMLGEQRIAGGALSTGFISAEVVEETLALGWEPGVCLDRDADGYGKGSCAGADCQDDDELVHAGAPERCNGQDDDCDGERDEATDLTPIPCDKTLGVCAGAMARCGGAAGWLTCEASDYGPLYEPGETRCDGHDNDCDGDTDEDLTPPACPLTLGVCANARPACLGAAGWGSCDYGPFYEAVESVCDGRDNDCDGDTDEPESVVCRPCTIPADCADGNDCTDKACVDLRCHYTPVAERTGCEDGLFCTAGDLCDGAGSCVGGPSPCVVECQAACDEVGRACGPDDPDTPCADDGQFCNGAEVCDGVGACVHQGDPCPGTPCNTCQEGSDSCADPPGTDCADGVFCNGADQCDGAGTCEHAGDPCPGTPCNTCQEGAGSCFDPPGTDCDQVDPCTVGDTCDGGGGCAGGADDSDRDNDQHAALSCGGDDCDDEDPDVSPDAAEGPPCDAAATCSDEKDNDCDGNTDGDDSNCPAGPNICLEGPSTITTGEPGEAVTVVLDAAGYDPAQIVCYTDASRLLPPEAVLLDSGFEDDLVGFTVSDPSDVLRDTSPTASGGYSVELQDHECWLQTDPIDTTGRARVQLSFAAEASALEDREYLITEYSTNGASWTTLHLMGDSHASSGFRRATHILPPDAEGAPGLLIRWRLQGGALSTTDSAHVDDVLILDLPEPTVRTSMLATGFEPGEGNATADPELCNSGVIVGFEWAIFGQTCLAQEAQNPLGTGVQGVSIAGSMAELSSDPIDTRGVPPGSDLECAFYMRSANSAVSFYANGWYRGGGLNRRMNGVGAATAEDWVWYRAGLEPAAIGVANLELRFEIPTLSSGGSGSGMQLDDLELAWSRASHDVLNPFEDLGDGRYSANISSGMPGSAELSCLFLGTDPPLETDGSEGRDAPLIIEFVAP